MLCKLFLLLHLLVWASQLPDCAEPTHRYCRDSFWKQHDANWWSLHVHERQWVLLTKRLSWSQINHGTSLHINNNSIKPWHCSTGQETVQMFPLLQGVPLQQQPHGPRDDDASLRFAVRVPRLWETLFSQHPPWAAPDDTYRGRGWPPDKTTEKRIWSKWSTQCYSKETL